ncbi:MAG: Rpn family recombination-promoting nuclease/putative transposase [Bacteriovoracales bacterium]|nr:Rpn family recombination-promoting nuclease/putative transposase [Bacteriovoracales bacterium]
MSEKKTHNLHDAFFRRILMDTELCKALLQTALPKREIELFNLSTLKAELGTFIDKNLKEHRSDVIVSLKFKGSRCKAKVFFLLEHKSYRDPKVLTQILRYQSEIYSSQEYLLEKTPVYTVLVHQGKRPWDFSGNFQDSELKKFPPAARKILKKRFIDFTCSYVDLQGRDLQKKTGHPGLSLALFVMKNIWKLNDKTVEKILLQAKDLGREQKTLIYDILKYIMKYDKRYAIKEKILELEDNALNKKDKFLENDPLLMFPWEEKALKKGLKKGKIEGEREGLKKGKIEGEREGLKKGKIEGKVEGLQEVAVRMLKEGMALQKIHKLTKLPKTALKKLKEVG